MLRLLIRLQSLLVTRRPFGEGGQATAEYSLVLLGAAAIALAAVAWATRSGKIGELFDTVFDLVLQRAR